MARGRRHQDVGFITAIILETIEELIKSGTLKVTAQPSNNAIGAVEIKDADADIRASVTSTYGLEVDVTRMSGILDSLVVDGDDNLLTRETNSILLHQVLLELKAMNIHLGQLSGVNINLQEV